MKLRTRKNKLNRERRMALNSFCLTGEGGGIDNSCGNGKGSTEVFHGTSESAIRSIAKTGIVPSGGSGADHYAELQGERYALTYADIEGRQTSVYVSKSSEQASKFASKAAKVNNSNPVVLRIEMPSQGLREDEAGGSTSSLRLNGSIRPEWIKEVLTIDWDNDRLVSRGPLPRTTHNSQSTTIYLCLLTKEKTANSFCPTGEGGGIDPSCSPGDSAAGKFGDVTVAIEKLNSIPSAGEGYITFEGGPDQIRTKDLGMKGIGKLKGGMPEDSKYYILHSIDPSKVSYSQSSVIRSAVAKKLNGEFEDNNFSTRGAPKIVKEGDEYYLQTGHHRAAAQILATGRITGLITEVASRSKSGKNKYKRPEGLVNNTRYKLTYNSKNRKGKNPLRLDPTRTITLRKGFTAKIRRQFARLKTELVKLIVVEDAFGLKEKEYPIRLNAFCPTGEGGGIDPSCSSTEVGSGKEPVSEAKSRLTDTSKERVGIAPFMRVDEAANDIILERETGRERGRTTDILIDSIIATQPRVDPRRIQNFIDYPRVKTSEKILIWSMNGKNYVGDGHHRIVAAKLRGETHISVRLVNVSKPTHNAFCPTGEGGGVDPSCSPGNSGSSGGSSTESKATGVLSRFKSQLDSVTNVPVLRQIKAASKFMKDKTGVIYKKLEGRYGKPAAISIMATGQAVSWGSTIAGAMVGVPIFLPGSSLWGALPAVAIAETVLQAHRGYRAARETLGATGTPFTSGAGGLSAVLGNVEELTREQLEEAWDSFYKEIAEEYNKYLEEHGGEIELVAGQLTTNARRWEFLSNPDKIKAFQEWLRTQIQANIRGKNEEALWKAYVEAGFKKGAGRSFDDVRQSRLRRERPDLFTRERQESVRDFYAGTREEFLRSSFGRPESIEKVKLLAGRSFDDLEGVTSAMSTRMSRILTDGLVQGRHPNDIARDLSDDVDISRSRAEMIARTEIIRAHADGQLQSLKELGVEEVGVAVEWSTAGDDSVCEECQPLEGVVLKLEEAQGLIPRHPNCRCSFIPANVGEDDKDQTDTSSGIQSAIRDSIEARGGDEEDTNWLGADRGISRDRPQSILNADYSEELLEFSRLVNNVFCATGEGGGVDPSCSTGEGTALPPEKISTAQKVLSGDKKKAEADEIFSEQESSMNIPQYSKWKFTEKEVSLGKLIATQSGISHDQLKRVEEYDLGAGAKNLPEIFVSKGSLYIGEGHHRVALAISRGKTTVRVKVYDKTKKK